MRYLWLVGLAFFFSSALCGKDNSKTKTAETAEAAASPVVVMSTSLGDVEIELNEKKAPVTVKNFLSYVEDKYYDGTVFHRVISTFMIQGGGFELKDKNIVQKKTKDPITNEGKNGLKNNTGTIAMARTGDPNSATSQFFINVKDNASLDYPKPDGHGYAVFGKVVSGMDVVNKIKDVKTGVKTVQARGPDGKVRDAPFRDVPETDVVIKSIRVKGSKPSKS
jgi:peptidyl-prolyl cis-trans isomerase A (cyclophilin A)